MSKLNQVIAVESGVKTRVNGLMSEVYKAVQHPALFEGFNKKYQPLAEDGEKFPDERKNVQMSAPDVIKQATTALTELFDVTATKDFGNCGAKSDVVVDGVPLLKDVPVTYLLFLEKQLTDLHTLVSKMPVLDSAENWTFDANSSLYRTEATQTVRTKKVQKALVLYPATDKHPAQCKDITEDQTVGNWEQTKFSGAYPAPTKYALVAKIEKLQKAVKYAREEANTTPATDQNIGSVVFNWLLGQ